SDYDIVFMDVDLPGMDGFKAAKKLRERDKEVALFFVTYLAQYAIRGYEFDAEDYILKPLKYESFALKLKKVLARIKTDTETSVLIKTTSGEFTFPSSSVIYAEISGHTIIYHTSDGDFEGYGTMKKVEEQLPKDTFFRCNSCYLVNLRYVSGIKGYTCVVGGYELKISHPRRKPFMEKLQEFYKNYSL
ncbi:MAG: response regulator transcription factor, partial [Schwartzia sp.]|nr:response regulator transcription factor [Schwartzia sp. (in: firmicutes)]